MTVAERYCQQRLAVDLRRVLLQKATLSPAEKRLLRKLDRRVQAFQDRARTGC